MIMNRKKIIAFCNQKGGVGKTFLATHVARKLQHNCVGKSVQLIDADPQGSSTAWYNKCDISDIFEVVIKNEPKMLAAKKMKNLADITVIDGPSDLAMNAAIIAVAYVIFIPVKPSEVDLDASRIIKEALNVRWTLTPGIPKAAFIVNMAGHNKGTKKMAKLLGELELPILPTYVPDRKCYTYALDMGETVFDRGGNPDARAALITLTRDIEEMLK